MTVPANLRLTHYEKIFQAMKAERTVKRITFDRNEAKPDSVRRCAQAEWTCGNCARLAIPGFWQRSYRDHVNNFLVQNVCRALVDKLVVKLAATTLQDTVGYDIYKIFEDFFLPEYDRNNMLLEGIQSEDLCNIRWNVGDKKTSRVDAENKLNSVYKNKYCIHLDHEIVTEHGVLYPQALYNDRIFKVALAPASQVMTQISWFTSWQLSSCNTRWSAANHWPTRRLAFIRAERSSPTTMLCEKRWFRRKA